MTVHLDHSPVGEDKRVEEPGAGDGVEEDGLCEEEEVALVGEDDGERED